MLWRRVKGKSREGWGCGKWLYRLLLQSRHKILSPSGKKPAPTSETEHWEQVKHGWCHWRSSNEMYFPPPKPKTRGAMRQILNWSCKSCLLQNVTTHKNNFVQYILTLRSLKTWLIHDIHAVLEKIAHGCLRATQASLLPHLWQRLAGRRERKKVSVA